MHSRCYGPHLCRRSGGTANRRLSAMVWASSGQMNYLPAIVALQTAAAQAAKEGRMLKANALNAAAAYLDGLSVKH